MSLWYSVVFYCNLSNTFKYMYNKENYNMCCMSWNGVVVFVLFCFVCFFVVVFFVVFFIM